MKTLLLSSAAFVDGEHIPSRYTCQGENLSPSLSWSAVPEGTQSLALIMDDPDAPGGTFVHWVLYDLPPDLQELPQRAPGSGVAGRNSFRQEGYGGPCPPPGAAHHYHFKLYALDQRLGLSPGATKDKVVQAMEGHILAWGELIGLYSR